MVDKKESQKLNRMGTHVIKGSFVRDADEFQAGLENAKATLNKKAAEGSFSGLMPDSNKVPLLYVDPMFDPILLMFPKENVKELNRRLRHYYSYHPIVRSILDLHSFSPDTDFIVDTGIKNVKDFVGGEQALCEDGKFHKVNWVQKTPFTGETFTFKPYYFPEITVTDKHFVPVRRGLTKSEKKQFKTGKSVVTWQEPNDKTIWIMAKEVKPEDYLIVPKFKTEEVLPDIDLSKYATDHWEVQDKFLLNLHAKNIIPRYVPVNANLSELLGWYVAEGSSSQTANDSWRTSFAFNAKDELHVVDRIQALVKELFNLDSKVHIHSGCAEVTVASCILGRFLIDTCGKGALNKKIPEVIMRSSKAHVRAFLKSYISGDGCLHGQKDSITVHTASKNLAFQLVTLCSKLDVLCQMHVPRFHKLSKNPQYDMQINTEVASKNIFDLELPFSKSKKNHPFYFEDTGFFYIRIRSIIKKNYNGNVYDVQTTDGTVCSPVLLKNSEFPLSDFELRCEDKEIERFYNALREKLNLLQMMVNLNRDYWLLGEGFFYGNWDQNTLEWSSFNQYPPENVEVHKTYVGSGIVYYLKADDELKRIINSPKEVDRAVASLIPDEFKDSVRQGKPFQLANERLIHFARRPSGYSLRGESICKSILKDLLYEDKLRLLQYTIVDRHMFPIKIWKIGSAEKGWIPAPKHFKAFQQQLIQAMNDPDFNLITHPFVDVKFESGVGKTEDLIKHFEFVQKRIMMGLFANDGMIKGEASPYATQAVSMRVVMHRYLTNRTLLEKLIREKVFLPVAVAHQFIKRTQAELSHNVRTQSSPEFYLPKFFYTQRLNLMNNTAEQEMLLRLRDKGEIPAELIADVFGWDLEAIKSAFKREQSTELDPVWREARKKVAEIPQVRNQILDGTKLEKMTIPEVTPTDKGGRPTKPEDEKSKYTPSIVPAGPAEAAPRAKAVERGTLPTPLGEVTKEAPVTPAVEGVVPPEVKI
jgi:intein/homing endonuclease